MGTESDDSDQMISALRAHTPDFYRKKLVLDKGKLGFWIKIIQVGFCIKISWDFR